MIVPDVNVLVYAHREDAQRHDEYAAWLGELVAGHDDLGLVDVALVGFVRIVTNPRVFQEPATPAQALAFVSALRAAPQARPVGATAATWDRFARLFQTDRQIKANLVPDAWLAALAISHGARLATADRGFARFPGLAWFDPVAP